MNERPLHILEVPHMLSPSVLAKLRAQLTSAGVGRVVVLEGGMKLRRIPLDMEAVVARWYGFRTWRLP